MAEDNTQAAPDAVLASEQCRAVAALARTLAEVHEARALIVNNDPALAAVIGESSAEIMEWLGDTLNNMDAVSEEDAWLDPIFEAAQARWPVAARPVAGVPQAQADHARKLALMIRGHQYGLRGFGDGSLSRGRNFTDRERQTVEVALDHLSTSPAPALPVARMPMSEEDVSKEFLRWNIGDNDASLAFHRMPVNQQIQCAFTDGLTRGIQLAQGEKTGRA